MGVNTVIVGFNALGHPTFGFINSIKLPASPSIVAAVNTQGNLLRSDELILGEMRVVDAVVL